MILSEFNPVCALSSFESEDYKLLQKSAIMSHLFKTEQKYQAGTTIFLKRFTIVNSTAFTSIEYIVPPTDTLKVRKVLIENTKCLFLKFGEKSFCNLGLSFSALFNREYSAKISP